MREIKFRALKDDMSDCSFVYGQLIYRIDELSGRSYPLITQTGQLYNSCLQGTECQYTGLKDKNGKEIYEGDILARTSIRDTIVEFDGAMFVAKKIGVNTSRYLGFYVDEFTVIIGNIYENPEILTQKQ